MPEIVSYTSAEEVRSLIGASVREIGDSSILLPVYAIALDTELRKVNQGLPELYATLLTKTTPTSIDTQIVNLVKLFSAYYVASEVGVPSKLLQKVTDGKSEMDRQSDTGIDIVARNTQKAATYRAELVTAVGTYYNSDTTVGYAAYILVSSPTYDPVTG